MCGFDELVHHDPGLVRFLDHIKDHLLLHLILLSLECTRAVCGLRRLPLLLALLLESCWVVTLCNAITNTKLLHALKHHVLISGFHRLFELVSLLKFFHIHNRRKHVFWLLGFLLLLRRRLGRLEAVLPLWRYGRVFHQRYTYMVTLE